MRSPELPIRNILGKQEIALTFLVIMSAIFVYVTYLPSKFYIDEQTYARLGYSLLQGHLASDSSFLQVYQKYGLVRNDIYTPFGNLDSVEPWLDHPPLMGILLVPLWLIEANPRLLPIILSSLSTFIVFFLLREKRALAWGASIAWIGFFTTHQILSMLFLDTGVLFFNLLTLALTSEYLKTHSRGMLYFAGIAAGAAAMSKEFGIASILYLFILVLYDRFRLKRGRLRYTTKPILLATSLAAIWPLYGLTLSEPVFVQILGINASRSVFSGHGIDLTSFIDSFGYSQVSLYSSGIDPTLLIGWIAIAYSLWRKNLRAVGFSFLSLLVVILITRYATFYTLLPFFPFFAIGLGYMTADVIRLLQRKALSVIADRNKITLSSEFHD